MAYTVLYTDEGLVGITNGPVQALPGVSYLTLDEAAPDLNTHVWDNDTRAFYRVATQLSKREFLARFTMEERGAIRSSTNGIVADLMFLLDAATYVDLTDPTLQQGVGYLSVVGLIAPERVAVILEI
jgi:hypothetical protein